jgi:hypothetical protein
MRAEVPASTTVDGGPAPVTPPPMRPGYSLRMREKIQDHTVGTFVAVKAIRTYHLLTAPGAPARPAAPPADNDARHRAGIRCLTLDTRTSIRVIMRRGPARSG